MRVLSGIQPSGQLHLGNYFGSIKPNLEYVGKADESFFFIADLHALTSVRDPKELRQMRFETVLDYLACGFDPKKATIYAQSMIPEHTELMWILSCIAPMGLLERAVSYKEKVEKGIDATVGLFNYPVLMAADILLYDANIVPVGRDQKQHVEIARDLAQKFNHFYGGGTLVVPEPEVRPEVAVVPGTDGQKMSKSYGNIIPLFGSEQEIKKAIMGIVTDSLTANAPKNPDKCTVYQIHKLFLSEKESNKLADLYREGMAYGEAKKKLFETSMDVFEPMRKKRAELEKKKDYILKVLQEGAAKACSVAESTMERVRKAVGLR
ncbi:tryptophan--tRNA ligase [Candidatus Peregrinibacteria bacterium]|nr:tryptophan--tRNA ligase [Candidatus Peregrinibacteria bacterium]